MKSDKINLSKLIIQNNKHAHCIDIREWIIQRESHLECSCYSVLNFLIYYKQLSWLFWYLIRTNNILFTNKNFSLLIISVVLSLNTCWNAFFSYCLTSLSYEDFYLRRNQFIEWMNEVKKENEWLCLMIVQSTCLWRNKKCKFLF